MIKCFIGGDIFSDFNEELEAAAIVEEERFYRYARFFSFNMALGLTSFDGNRGKAYENNPPTYGVSVTFFSSFQTAYSLGLEYSKHHFFIDHPVHKYNNNLGMVEVSMLRVFFAFRRYLDTSDLGTAITYANPYVVARPEYWYTTNKFIDQPSIPNNGGGGIGLGVGFGLEFPMKVKESYLGVEFLFHTVNFHDKYTQDYRPRPDSSYGYEDLSGNAYSTMVSYIINW